MIVQGYMTYRFPVGGSLEPMRYRQPFFGDKHNQPKTVRAPTRTDTLYN